MITEYHRCCCTFLKKNLSDSDYLITYGCFFLHALIVTNMSQSIERLVFVVLQLSQTCPEVVLKVQVGYYRILRIFFSAKFFCEK